MTEQPMTPEYSARASIEGHRYHWTWAARRALSLVAFDSDLEAIAIEDLPDDYIDGAEVADTVEYFGGVGFENCTRLVVQQFKYSLTAPDDEFTWSFLTKTLKKFASIYAQWVSEYGLEKVHARARFALITNRPAKKYIEDVFSNVSMGSFDFEALVERDKNALNRLDIGIDKLADFMSLVSLQASSCSTVDLEKYAKLTLADWCPGVDTTTGLASIRDKVVALAGAEGELNNLLYPADIWAFLGVTGREDLFPVPNEFPAVENIIPRNELVDLVEKLTEDLPVLVTADGGEGKTVFLESISQSLSSTHFTLIYDCFANGRYRVEGEERHLSQNAFVQLINTLATKGLCDLIIPNKYELKQPAKLFRKRITQAISTLRQQSHFRDLLLIIDAADNAAELADQRREPCFIHTILDSIRDEPIDGLKLIFSSRGYRKDLVVKTHDFNEIPLTSLPEEDCIKWIQRQSTGMTVTDAKRVYSQARGNPRKIDYLLKLPIQEWPDKDQITLNEIFDIEWKRILSDFSDQSIDVDKVSQMMAAIARLAPPVPLSDLASAFGVAEDYLRNITLTLFPLLEEAHDGLIFRDEPIEHWFRQKFSVGSAPVRQLIQTFKTAQSESIFAANALPQLLEETGDLQSLLDIVDSAVFPETMETQSARHRLSAKRILAALRLALDNDQVSTCMSLLYCYGRLATVDERADEHVLKYTALAAFSRDEDSSRRCWANRSGWKGSWAARMSVYNAIRGDLAGAANSTHNFSYWLDWWFRTGQEDAENDRDKPSLTSAECAANAVVLAANGRVEEAITDILRWSPVEHQLAMARHFFSNVRYLQQLDMESVLSAAYKALCSLKSRKALIDKKNSRRALGLTLACFEQVDISSDYLRRFSSLLSAQLKDFSFSYSTSNSLEIPGTAWKHQLITAKAMATGQKRLCRLLLKSGFSKEPSLYRFHDEFDRKEIGFFVINRVLTAWVNGRTVTRWDLLPAEFRNRLSVQACSDKEKTKASTDSIINSARAKKAKKKNHSQLAFSDRDQTHFQWVVNELFEFSGILFDILENGVSLAKIKQLLHRAELGNEGAPYFVTHACKLLRLRLFLPSLTVAFSTSSNLSKSTLEELLSRLSAELLRNDSNYDVLEYLHEIDPSDLVKSRLSVLLSDDIERHETVEEKSDAYARLAHQVVLFDHASAKLLYLKGLNSLDGVGTNDNDLVTALLGLASHQTGGTLCSKLSHRLVRFCEINFEHVEDKFPFDELARAASRSIGIEYFRFLFGWHSADSVPLRYCLLQTLSRFSEQAIISSSHAALGSLLADGAGSFYRSADGMRLIIFDRANKECQTKIQGLFDWQKKYEVGEESSWSPDETRAERDRNYEIKLDTTSDSLRFQRDNDRQNKIVQFSKTLDPIRPDFVESLSKFAQSIDNRFDLLPTLLEVAKSRLRHTEVLDFIDQILEESELNFTSKINLINLIILHWQDSSVELRNCRANLYPRLLQVGAPEYLYSSYGVSSFLTYLSLFIEESREKVAKDVIIWLGKNRKRIGSFSAFSLGQALIPISSPESAFTTLQSFLDTEMFADLDAHGIVPLHSDLDGFLTSQNLLSQIIWNQLGDPDSELRWRAVHTFIKTAEFQEYKIIGQLVELFDYPGSNYLRHPEHKQHIWNAREFFLISCLNIAKKFPEALREQLEWFKALAGGRFENIIIERYAGNILHLLELALNGKSTTSLNEYPRARLSIAKVEKDWGGGRWDFIELERERGFRLDYDFGKSYPSDFFRKFDVSQKEAGELFMKNIKGLDSDCEGMHDAGGRNRPRQEGRNFNTEKEIYYGQQLAQHAVYATYSKLLKTHALVEDDYDPGLELESLFEYRTVTYLDGRLLHDETSPRPEFTQHGFLTGSTSAKSVKSANEIAALIGLNDKGLANNAWIPVEGLWSSPDNASIRVLSALVKRRGSIKKARELASVSWIDLWLPAANEDYTRYSQVCKDRAPQFVPWIEKYQNSSGIDEKDLFASSQATQKSAISDALAKSLGLLRDQFEWYDANQMHVAKSISWGTQVVHYRYDKPSEGRALLVTPSFLGNALHQLQMDLMMTVHVDHYPNQRFSSDTRTLRGGFVLKIAPNGKTKIWPRALGAEET